MTQPRESVPSTVTLRAINAQVDCFQFFRSQNPFLDRFLHNIIDILEDHRCRVNYSRDSIVNWDGSGLENRNVASLSQSQSQSSGLNFWDSEKKVIEEIKLQITAFRVFSNKSPTLKLLIRIIEVIIESKANELNEHPSKSKFASVSKSNTFQFSQDQETDTQGPTNNEHYDSFDTTTTTTEGSSLSCSRFFKRTSSKTKYTVTTDPSKTKIKTKPGATSATMVTSTNAPTLTKITKTASRSEIGGQPKGQGQGQQGQGSLGHYRRHRSSMSISNSNSPVRFLVKRKLQTGDDFDSFEGGCHSNEINLTAMRSNCSELVPRILVTSDVTTTTVDGDGSVFQVTDL